MTAPALDQAARRSGEAGYDVSPDGPNEDLEAIARLAASLCRAARAAVVVGGEDAYAVVAAHEVPRDRVSLQTAAGMPLVAAAPLLDRRGAPVGSLRLYAEQDASQEASLDAALDARRPGLLADLAAQAVALLELRRMAVTLARGATRDGLTGLANRRSAEQAIAAAVTRAERGLGTPSVVMVDLDDFRQVNDAFGPVAGDAVLRTAAARLVRTARAVDTVARVGGDEFVVLLEHTGGPGAVAALHRLRASLDEGLGAAGDVGVPCSVSASLGMATYRPGDSVASLLARADAEMFAEKARRG